MTAEQLALVDDHIRIGLAMHAGAPYLAALVALRAELARLQSNARGAMNALHPSDEERDDPDPSSRIAHVINGRMAEANYRVRELQDRLCAVEARLTRMRGAIAIMLPTCEAALEVLEGLTAPEEGEIEPWLETQLKTAIEAAKEAKK